MPLRDSPAAPSVCDSDSIRHADWPGLMSGIILAFGTIAVYGRTFTVPFLFDDSTSIAENLTIRRLWPVWPAFSPPGGAGVGGRPLLNFTYALNYAFGGTAVAGYHVVNLAIHALAAWTLFALVRRILLRPNLRERFGTAATPLALAVSAIWAWHPVQTEAVTYLTQRGESLMGLFYLLTVFCFVRGAAAEEASSRRIWFSLSVLACLAGVATKEVIVTAPVMVLLIDRAFFSGSFAGAWRRHRPLYLALAATWIPLGCLMTGLRQRSVGFGLGVPWWEYGLTETRAIITYLRLAFWPHPLVFDYGAEARVIATRLAEIWPSALVLGLLLAGTGWGLLRSPARPGGFAGAWFLLILAPTSSIIPLTGQPIAEHRLYLPLAGVAAFVVLGTFALAGRHLESGLLIPQPWFWLQKLCNHTVEKRGHSRGEAFPRGVVKVTFCHGPSRMRIQSMQQDLSCGAHGRAKTVSRTVAWHGGLFRTIRILFALTACCACSFGQDFRHPGILNSRQELEFIKAMVRSDRQPWKQAFEALKASRYSSLAYEPHAFQEVCCGPYNKPNVGCNEMVEDGVAAYSQSLMWYLTDDQRYADSAIAIIHAWASTYQRNTQSNSRLVVSWAVPWYVNAAEILRYRLPWADARSPGPQQTHRQRRGHRGPDAGEADSGRGAATPPAHRVVRAGRSPSRGRDSPSVTDAGCHARRHDDRSCCVRWRYGF